MTKAARSIRRDAEADDAWKAALEGDRKAFQAAVRPYLGELLRAARHEVRYRVALGDFRKDEPTAEELAGEVLISRGREIFLLCELHRVPLTEAALALGISVEEAGRRLEEARRDLCLGQDRNLI